MRIAWKVLLVLVAGAALLWFLLRADLGEIGRALAGLGWVAPVLVAPYLLVYWADTMGWWFSFRRTPPVGFLTLARIRWAGEAVNNVVPSAYLGGEAVKVYLLGKRGVPMSSGAPAAVVSKTVQSLAQVACIALGGLAFVSLGVAPPIFQQAMLGVFIAGSVGIAALFWIQRRGMFRFLFDLLRRLRWCPRALAGQEATLRQFDREISEFYLGHRGRFLGAWISYLAGWLLDALEIYLAAHLLGVPLSLTQALAIETFVGVAKAMSIFIPAAMGVQDSSIVVLCRLAGVPESFGFTYAVLRRARELVFVLIGWAWLALEETSLKGLAGRVNRPSESLPP